MYIYSSVSSFLEHRTFIFSVLCYDNSCVYIGEGYCRRDLLCIKNTKICIRRLLLRGRTIDYGNVVMADHTNAAIDSFIDHYILYRKNKGVDNRLWISI
jgi:hypothetical protein